MQKILFISLVYTSLAVCPQGFVEHEGSCYHVIRIQATWAEGRMYCHAYGSKLVSIETQKENTFLVNYLKSIDNQVHSARFWIGGNDIAQTGTYIWEGTQLPLNAGYTNYYQGSPDNGGDNLEEHCMEMSDRYNYEWNDNECKSKFYPICEMSGEDAEIIG
ncbi:perlucin-like isoform X2 [Crassostrea angulata]|uniref:C-type lectin domain-containing protein n=1 Tax=Magallana gigas TaxID=29159 RepID=A0A8W8N900_MAGGI|nr:perlucin-like isoform X2 [Crassostrea angulata]